MMSRFVYAVFRFFTFLLFSRSILIGALDCFSCDNVTDFKSCVNTITCNANQSCYMQTSSSTNNATFSMGCLDNQHCQLQAGAGSLIGRGLHVREQSNGCLECCSTYQCNDQLCSHRPPSACVDDETLDCARLNSLLNVCADKQHAKTICPKFCNLCDIVDGSWAKWSAWSKCSVTCGNGTVYRTRTCTDPAPAHGGEQCQGQPDETNGCTQEVCPVDGGWSGWFSWEPCSVTCRTGIQRRHRNCSNPTPSHGGNYCLGDTMDDRLCQPGACPVVNTAAQWSDWNAWSSCSKSCGIGIRQRTRTCLQMGHQSSDCDGKSYELVACANQACDVNTPAQWSNWNAWNDCSSSCGNGFRERTRTCLQMGHNSSVCAGRYWEVGSCDSPACRALECFSCYNVNSLKSCVTTISCKAKQSCYLLRTSSTSNPTFSMGCLDNQHCRLNRDAGSLIGRGLHVREQSNGCLECCSTYQCNDQLCSHRPPSACMDDETLDCARLNTLLNVCEDKQHAKTICPKFCNLCDIVDGNWASWSAWSRCSVTCGNGTVYRTRTCTDPAPAHGGEQCQGQPDETQGCSQEGCSVDGGWSDWLSWEPCSVICGAGIQRRHRKCSNPTPRHGGNYCVGDTMDVRLCQQGACPGVTTAAQWSDWNSWSGCSKSCDNGFKQRTRTCLQMGHQSSDCDGRSYEVVVCTTQTCSVDTSVQWSDWNVWSACTTSCGSGFKQRTRTCLLQSSGCVGNAWDVAICVSQACP